MGDNIFELYSQKILALATQIPLTEPIEQPAGRAKKRSPICGSEVEVMLSLSDDKISEYSQIVNACALGQASSSIFAHHVIGCSGEKIQKLCDELRNFLAGEGPAPIAPFEDYAILEAAQNHKNRHASIMLPVETTILALENAQKNRSQGSGS